MPFLLERAYRRMGRHYFLLYVAFEFVSAFVVCLATLGLFALYTDQSSAEFWRIAAFAEVCVLVSTAFMMWWGARRIRPILAWMEGQGGAREAWRSAVEVPRARGSGARRRGGSGGKVRPRTICLGVGIGVNSGSVVVGSVGGGGRLEFAVIGDPVNVAARVESLTRETGDVVLLTEATRCFLSDDGNELVPRGTLR